MTRIILTIAIMLFGWTSMAQNFLVQGTVTDGIETKPKALVQVENTEIETLTDTSGKFVLQLPQGSYSIRVSLDGYVTQRLSVDVKQTIDLSVFLEKMISIEEVDNHLISETDFADEGADDMAPEFLESSRDVYFQRAAYDFSQVFYRPRGYESKEASVLINGIPMAKMETGRAQWSNWGGLNDMTRNQVTRMGATPSQYDFGGAFGSNYISVRPSEMRAGLRLSATASNRTYAGRTMATYVPRWSGKGFTYALSASRRWANNGNYIDGMLYYAYSLSAALEYKPNYHSSFSFLSIYSDNERGKSSPLTQEAIALGGRRYNPNWGYQNGDIRNSKMKRIAEPIFILSHLYNKNGTVVSTNLGYQFGQVGDTRVQYGKGQNPDPTYYTNMPTYFYNMHRPGEATHDPFAIEKTAYQIQWFRNNSQLNWDKLYMTNYNGSGESLYVLNEDVIDTKTLTGNVLLSSSLGKNIDYQVGATYQNISSDNFQQINDLLGGKYFLNKSYYTNEWYNNANEALKEGDKYQYHYKANADKFNTFAQLHLRYKRAKFFLAGKYDYTAYQRDGQFENNATYVNSKGKSSIVEFHSLSGKAGITYVFSSKHTAQISGGYLHLPQTINSIFVNIRNSNYVIPSYLTTEKQLLAEANYDLRLTGFQARLTGYATQFKDAMEKNFFYSETYLGENSGGFLTETMVGIDKLHYGVELGAEAEITPRIKATFVASVNDYRYSNNPTLIQSSDNSLLSDPKIAYIKNYRVAAGPQQAYSVALEYRSPKYWWVGASANFFRKNFVDIAPSLRTTNFYLNPTTGSQFDNIDEGKVRELLKQEDLGELFLVNLTGGKSWRVKGKYVSLFVSVNNLLNTQFKSGGFEQVRKGNYQAMLQDKANGYPVFGNKYFVGYGVNYMANLLVSF